MSKKIVGAKVTDEEVAAIKRAAETECSSVSVFVRRVLVDWLRERGYVERPPTRME
jgi:uncharacterized protein (DUF1778 family)